MQIIIILFILLSVWRLIAALVKQNRHLAMMLTVLHNKKELDNLTDGLTVCLRQAADRYDRIDILTARLPRYFSLVTGRSAERFEKWVERNPKKVEMIEGIMDNDSWYLRNAMADIDKIFGLKV